MTKPKQTCDKCMHFDPFTREPFLDRGQCCCLVGYDSNIKQEGVQKGHRMMIIYKNDTFASECPKFRERKITFVKKEVRL